VNSICGFPVHPAAEAFPLLQGEEFNKLVASVKENGLRDPIVYVTGSTPGEQIIIDGRNRLRACIKAGVTPEFTRYAKSDVVSFVVDKNLNRRHLDESARAMAAARLANVANGSNRFEKKIGVSIDTPVQPAITLEDAARKLNVGRASAARARKVIAEGAKDLIDAVDQGKVTVSAAAKIADLPKDKQPAEIAKHINPSADKPKRDPAALKRQVLDLSAKGMPIIDISATLGIHDGTVSKWIKDPGAVPSGRGFGGGHQRKLSDSEVGRLFEEGRSAAEIANLLNSHRGTVEAYLRRLGLSRAGKKSRNLLIDHISRALASAAAWEAGADSIVAAASVSPPDQVGELISALSHLSRVAATLKARLNKEAGKKEGNVNG
jgi:DNA-binding NarL/FixJ family response regulator